jgi:trk system potassium uptake protein
MKIRVLSGLLIMLAISMLAPYLYAWFTKEGTDLVYLKIILPMALFGYLGLRKRTDLSRSLSIRDSYLMVVMAWCLYGFFGALPFWFISDLSFTDAAFESFSGFTTTGSSILTDIEALYPSLLLWRSITHWLGGMGIIVLGLALIPIMGARAFNLYRAEVSGPSKDKIGARLQQTAKILWMVYVGFTVLQILLLRYVGSISWFDAVNHSFSTIASGGYSTLNASVAGLHSSAAEWIIIVFMFIAGSNFVLHFMLINGNFKAYLGDVEFRAYALIVLLAISIVAFILHMHEGRELEQSLRPAAFQVLSIITTTGFATEDYTLWPVAAQTIIFVLMFVGGCAGSTAGGVKIIRLIIVLKTSFSEIAQILHPNGVFITKLYKQVIREDVMRKVVAFVALYFFFFFAGGVVLALSGVELMTAFTASLASLGCIGPGFGGVGPAMNYAPFTDFAKWVMVFLMLLGRLELFTLLILFTKQFWRR